MIERLNQIRAPHLEMYSAEAGIDMCPCVAQESGGFSVRCLLEAGLEA